MLVVNWFTTVEELQILFSNLAVMVVIDVNIFGYFPVCLSVCLFVHSCSEQSGCQIRLEEPKPGSTQRIITIIGHQNGIQLAQSLLQNRYVCV